jgi:hypothetical protein
MNSERPAVSPVISSARGAEPTDCDIGTAATDACGSEDSTQSCISLLTTMQSEAVEMLRNAMTMSSGLNPPRLARKIRTMLGLKGTTNKFDRATIYRFFAGKTKKPHPDILNGIIEALELGPGPAEFVRRAFGTLRSGTRPRKPSVSAA